MGPKSNLDEKGNKRIFENDIWGEGLKGKWVLKIERR